LARTIEDSRATGAAKPRATQSSRNYGEKGKKRALGKLTVSELFSERKRGQLKRGRRVKGGAERLIGLVENRQHKRGTVAQGLEHRA